MLVECDGLAPDAALNIAEALVRQSKAVRAAELLIAGALEDDPTTPWQERENAACLSVLDRLLALSDYERRATARLGRQLRKV
jgi:hypothetical protein